ncbi:MAG: GNAT family N-acetyltransferase [Bacillus sp. (in: firmicutes)]
MRIRKGVHGDYLAVAGLFRQVQDLHANRRPDIFKKAEEALPEEEFGLYVDSADAFICVAEQDGSVVGVGVMMIHEIPDDEIRTGRTVAYIDALCVDSLYRQQRIGESIFKAMRDEAALRNATSLELDVGTFNKAAIRFYEKMGMNVKSYAMELRLQ